MTREQQRKLKELKIEENLLHKTLVKEYKLKKRDYMIWKVKDGLFFDMYSSVLEQDDICKCRVKAKVKPLWADDLLWDILGMSENKNEPLSLRSNGAFTVSGVTVFEIECELPNWETNELRGCLQNSYEAFVSHIEKIDADYYNNNLNSDRYHDEIRSLLMLIHTGQYEKAVEYASNMKNDYFCNGELSFPMSVIRYCENKQIY